MTCNKMLEISEHSIKYQLKKKRYATVTYNPQNMTEKEALDKLKQSI